MTDYENRILEVLTEEADELIYRGSLADLSKKVGNPTLLKEALKSLVQTQVVFEAGDIEAHVCPLVQLVTKDENIIVELNEYYVKALKEGAVPVEKP